MHVTLCVLPGNSVKFRTCNYTFTIHKHTIFDLLMIVLVGSDKCMSKLYLKSS